MTMANNIRPLASAGPYQRLSPEDIEVYLEAIRAAAAAGDHEDAHSLEDKLAWLVIQKLAHRGSRIAKLALTSRDINFARRCG